MNRLVRRYIVLFLSIFIPLMAAFLVGSYGYNSEKFGQKAWKDEFAIEYLSFEGEYTTEEKIEKFMKYGINNQYYSFDPTPILKQELKSDNDKKLLDVIIYRVVYDLDAKGTDRFQYVFFFYNVQYQNIRDMFVADESLRQDINKENVPTFVPRISTVTDDIEDSTERGITQIPEEQLSFPDYDADFDFKSGKNADDDDALENESLINVFIGFVPMREVTAVTKYNIKINAMISKILDDEGNSIKTEVANFDIDLEVNPEKIDYSEYESSHKQDLNSAGYFGWAFKNYLWWIGLITFAAIGLITGSFYLVYISEEKRLTQENKNKKKRK